MPAFRVSADSVRGLAPAQGQKMQQALRIFEQVMNDTAFQRALARKKFHYDRKRDVHRGMITAQVMAEVWAAKERFTTAPDGTANIFWYVRDKPKPGWGKNLTMGGGGSKSKTFYTNSWFVDKEDDLDGLIGHAAHEWTHKLRFQHKQKSHKRRDETFPYVFGYLVREHAKKYVPR